MLPLKNSVRSCCDLRRMYAKYTIAGLFNLVLERSRTCKYGLYLMKFLKQSRISMFSGDSSTPVCPEAIYSSVSFKVCFSRIVFQERFK
jgi:hypothetical protein